MQYSNDESDREIRKKNYYLGVYIVPALAVIVICGLAYMAFSAHYLSKADTMYGCFSSVSVAIILFAFNKRNWLKMPDGSFYNTKGIQRTDYSSTDEPREYEEEYFYSKKNKIISVLLGFVSMGAGVYLAMKGRKNIILPIVVAIATGAFLMYSGITGLLNKLPGLRLAKQGLWTKKLGFINWKNIVKAQVIEDKTGKSPQTILEIYRKGTVFAEASQPDERLFLTDLENKEYIEMVIVNMIRNAAEKPA